MKLGNYYTHCTSQKKLQNNSIKVSHYVKMETIFLNRENLNWI